MNVKVDQNMPQDEIAASIIDKLGESGGISYSAIASRAFDKNKKDLAVKVSIVYCYVSIYRSDNLMKYTFKTGYN